MTKPSLEKNNNDVFKGLLGDKGGHTFPKDISLKMNVIVQVEFELAYFEVAIQHVDHYTTENHFSAKEKQRKMNNVNKLIINKNIHVR